MFTSIYLFSVKEKCLYVPTLLDIALYVSIKAFTFYLPHSVSAFIKMH